MVKNLSAVQETWVGSLVWKDPLEEGMATHSSILAGESTWIEEPGGLQSMGSQRVGHDWTTNTHFSFIPCSSCLPLNPSHHFEFGFQYLCNFPSGWGHSLFMSVPPLCLEQARLNEFILCTKEWAQGLTCVCVCVLCVCVCVLVVKLDCR